MADVTVPLNRAMMDMLIDFQTRVKELEAEVNRLRLYERAMQSMAAQFIHPKMTAEELATAQLETKTSRA